MANDPNRDLLPVKDVDDRSNKGINYRMDHNVISKLKRSDLEDKYMRLYDENTHIKKQLNSQEEKIKRLGTKLLRLIGEKKNCPNSCRRRQDGKGADELQMRIIELEHENYTLKDRNVVLKQQLANHARQHVAAHRSPNRSVHNSPMMSQRQSSAPNVNDNYMLSNRNQTQDIQLREAEEHINGLNEEIKSLHNKIDSLQQDLEKSSLENQKTKVCENIELIRLQRSLKQQSVQIAALQAQIKNSEKNQKFLREELSNAHKENEDSLQIISDKQKEILDLYTKLEEKNLGRLEFEEMKERIKDLTSERDSLRERGEFLMKTIESKSSETDIIKELRRLLASEKSKKKELKESLENTQKLLESLKDIGKGTHSSEEAISKAPITEDADKTIGTIEIESRLNLKNGEEKESDLLSSNQIVYRSERNSDLSDADSKIEDKERRKFSMGNQNSNVKETTENSPKVKQLEDQLLQMSKELQISVLELKQQKIKINDLEEKLKKENIAKADHENLNSEPNRSQHEVPQTSGSVSGNERANFVERKYLESSDENDDEVEKPVNENVSKRSKKRNPNQTMENFSYRSGRSQSQGMRENIFSRSNQSVRNPDKNNLNKKGETEASQEPPVLNILQVKPVLQGKKKPQVSEHSPHTSVSQVPKIRNSGSIKLSIEWLQLLPNTSIWRNESIKLLFIDFAFFDVRGEVTETPTSLRKPENPEEKCFFNFTTIIRITRERANLLRLIRNRLNEGLIIFKVVSEPEESNEECADIGVAQLTVKQFFKSIPNQQILIAVKNTSNLDELIGMLSIRLDTSRMKLPS